MKLILNLSMIGDKPTGLGVYARNCARIVNAFKTKVIQSGRAFTGAQDNIMAPRSVAIGEGKLAAIKRQLWMRRLRFDHNHLVYSPTHHGLPRQDGQIITIHDMICLRFPQQHRLQYIFFKYFIPHLLRKCRAVFTVSETTKFDIADVYGFPVDKIFVVPNSVDTDKFSPGQADVDSPYLLMVGARYTHKNVDEVLRNARLWKDKYRLVVTSCSGKYRESLEHLIDQYGIRDRVVFHDYVSSDKLIELYQRCTALVYPSKWEGFGIPPLEALACGRPVIASDIKIHREVLGGAAFYVELGNEASWRRAFTDLEDPRSVADHIMCGMTRVKLYSPEKALSALKSSLLAVEPKLEMIGEDKPC